MVSLYVLKVTFKEPPFDGDSQKEFFFTSLSAIYEVFTVKDIGCKVTRLWNVKIKPGKPYKGKRCTIERVELKRKSHIKPNAGL